MQKIVVVFLALVFAAVAPAASPHRVLVIEAPSQDDVTYQGQAAELIAGWTGLVERDFIVRTRFRTKGFSIVLIGKDGGEKLRRNSLLTTRELFSLVDAMPMRKAEMARKP